MKIATINVLSNHLITTTNNFNSLRHHLHPKLRVSQHMVGYFCQSWNGDFQRTRIKQRAVIDFLTDEDLSAANFFERMRSVLLRSVLTPALSGDGQLALW